MNDLNCMYLSAKGIKTLYFQNSVCRTEFILFCIVVKIGQKSENFAP